MKNFVVRGNPKYALGPEMSAFFMYINKECKLRKLDVTGQGCGNDGMNVRMMNMVAMNDRYCGIDWPRTKL